MVSALICFFVACPLSQDELSHIMRDTKSLKCLEQAGFVRFKQCDRKGKQNQGAKAGSPLTGCLRTRETNRKLESYDARRPRSLARGQMYLWGIIHLAAAGQAGLQSGDWQTGMAHLK